MQPPPNFLMTIGIDPVEIVFECFKFWPEGCYIVEWDFNVKAIHLSHVMIDIVPLENKHGWGFMCSLPMTWS